MKFYLITRPSMIGSTIPVYYYTFAENENSAISKVRLKWGEYDSDIKVRELNDNEIEQLVIATNYFG